MRAISFEANLRWLNTSDHRSLLAGGLKGIEKESLRITDDGRLSQRAHRREWGSALTHPYLTTDYSEALLEFVTPPYERIETTLGFLDELHAFVLGTAEDEILWPSSMPCVVDADVSMPIARYGPSNEGRLRSVYRSGLGYRYGRAMQAIAGVHFNYSPPGRFWPAYREHLGSDIEDRAFRSDMFLGLVRNFRRIGWLVVYLYGASPAFCKSFQPNGHEHLESLDADTWYAPFATSLRMSDMGYRNSTQAKLSVSANSMDRFLCELTAAVTTVEPLFEKIGVVVDGDYRQLNANVLQIENEYYSSIRPKAGDKRQRLIEALRSSGIEYVEARTLDLNPFAPSGIAAEQARFIEALLLYCLLSDSAPISETEQTEIDRRDLAVAWRGRQPGLGLSREGRTVELREWALEVVDAVAAVAALLDGGSGEYTGAVGRARSAVVDPAGTLSAAVLERLRSGRQSFFDFSLALGRQHREHLSARQWKPGRLDELRAIARRSLEETAAIEASSHQPFPEFLDEFAARLRPGSANQASNCD